MVTFVIEYIEKGSFILSTWVVELSIDSIIPAVHAVLTALSNTEPCLDGQRFVGSSSPLVSQLVRDLAAPFVRLSCDNQFIYWKPTKSLPAPCPPEEFPLPRLPDMMSVLQPKLVGVLNDWTVRLNDGPIHISKDRYTKEWECDFVCLLSHILCRTAAIEVNITRSGIEYVLNEEQMQELAINRFY